MKVDGNFEAGKLGERLRAKSIRTDDVSFLVRMLDYVLFILKWLPRSCGNCSWIKVTFTNEKKHFSDHEIHLGNGGEGKWNAELVKLCQNAASLNQPNLDCSRC